MMTLCSDLLHSLQGKTLVTAESCTGGGIGAAITSVPGSSAVFKGGIISYCNSVKSQLLQIDSEILDKYGAVSAPVAEAMARGARTLLDADVSVSVTGLAGPDGDEFGNPVGTVFIGYCDSNITLSRKFMFLGDRAYIQSQAIRHAVEIVLEMNK